jgi:hypothetical protein
LVVKRDKIGIMQKDAADAEFVPLRDDDAARHLAVLPPEARRPLYAQNGLPDGPADLAPLTKEEIRRFHRRFGAQRHFEAG